MQFVRSLNLAQARQTAFPGFSAQFLSSRESGLVTGCWIDAGGSGPGLHYHLSDQSSLVVAGEANVQIGDAVYRLSAGTFVHIPAGVPHRNWNDSSAQEVHIEVHLPGPQPGAPLMYPVDTPAEAPAPDMCGIVYSTDDGDGFATREDLPGVGVRTLSHNERSIIRAICMAPDGKGLGTRIYGFDQYCMVLEGVLQVEIALERHEVTAGSVVLLPAGVPHRVWNEGPGFERHIALLSPTPREGTTWGRGVDISFSGVEQPE